MSMPLSPTRLFVCTACGAVLPVGEEHLGKKCRCGRCGKVSVILGEHNAGEHNAGDHNAEDHNAEEAARRRAERTAASNPSIHFNCRVCDTHLSARAKHVGRKAKCPDCGALTKVPPPPRPRPKKEPKAIHGQQYGIWGVDDAPNPAELRAKQPKFFPVYCRNCDTLMHAKLEQVGKKLVCPDCGAKTVVEEPPKPKQKKSPLVPDGHEYQLDGKHIPPTRPEAQFAPPEPSSETLKTESIRQERVDRPKIPRVPIILGVTKMLLRMPVVSWYFWLSGVALTAGGFLLIVSMINPIAAIPFFLAAAAGAILSLSAVAAICLAVLTESSEGNDRLYHPPGPIFLDWMGDVFYLIFPAVLAMAPWWLLSVALQQELPKEHQGLVIFVGWLFTFPLLLLSSLENGSFMEPFSFRIFGSVTKCPGHWLLFVLESAIVVGGTIAAVGALATRSPAAALLVIPLCVASALLYFRILGRFAWWLAESEKTKTEE